MKIIDKNDDFFTENARFRWLIRHYANQLIEPHAEGELWGFLWLLLNSDYVIPNDRYVCVCIRNHFLKLKKSELKFFENELEFIPEITPTKKPDLDFYDFKEVFAKLPKNEREVILDYAWRGYNFREIAERKNTTKQNECRKYLRVKRKLRNYVIEEEKL